MPKKIQNFARSALVTPITVNVGRAGAASMNIVQDVEFVTTEAKIIYILGKGPSINDVSSEGEGGGPPSKPMKGDENRYLVLSKADVVLDPSK